MYSRHTKPCEKEFTLDAISVSGHEMILYPRTVLYEFMLRKKQQRKIKHYNYKISSIQRRVTTGAVAVARQVDVNRRNRHRDCDDVKHQGRGGDGIRAGGRSKSSSVHREQSVEQEDPVVAAVYTPRPQLSVRVRSVLQYNKNNNSLVPSAGNMSTATAAALTRATREPIQSNAPERLLVTTTGVDMQNNSLFSSQRQCSENESNSNTSEQQPQTSSQQQQQQQQQQQCYLNSTYDILYQRHVDTLNKVISDSATQIQNLDKKQQQQQQYQQKVKQPITSEHRLNFVQQQQQAPEAHQQIRISVSSSEDVAELDSGRSTSQDASSLDTDSGTLEERRSPPAASDCSSEIGSAIESLNIDPSKPRIVLSQQQQQPSANSEDPQLLSSTNRRSRSPSPLLEVPVESVDISREIRRPPIQ